MYKRQDPDDFKPSTARSSRPARPGGVRPCPIGWAAGREPCLLYTSDAADERSSVDLGGRRIINKKTYVEPRWPTHFTSWCVTTTHNAQSP